MLIRIVRDNVRKALWTQTKQFQCHRCLFSSVRMTSKSSNHVDTNNGPLKKTLDEDILKFDDYRRTCKNKSLFELTRALFLFRLCSFDVIVNNSLQILTVARRVMGQRLFSFVMKPLIYDQFVAGDAKNDVIENVRRLRENGIRPLLGVPIEDVSGKLRDDTKYDGSLQTILNCISFATELEHRFPMMHLKLTAFMPADSFLTLSKLHPRPLDSPDVIESVANTLDSGRTLYIEGLHEKDNQILNKGLSRIRDMCQAAEKKGVIVMVDAEYTYLNPALNLISLAMMLSYNTRRPLIFHTYQNYLKGAYSNLESDIDFVMSHGACFGSKLVRGAYINIERNLALENGYADPVHDSFDKTTQMYYASIDKMFDLIVRHPGRLRTLIGSHNEDTIRRSIERMNSMGISSDNESVFFGQVFGMCDHVSIALGQCHPRYMVCKSLPYGSVEETLSYLSRRAVENKEALHGTRRDRQFLWRALKDRVLLRGKD